ncbi:MAG: TetR/AcrR family transcriptional regulator [Candidatus Mcinerneyibacterium aminivorans]|uniref:TetR/AcrR family transcriptional regulator n=1 Tax=Candidatus Mcinerneyibacterium aminivorans TaxID=2703815 RepID=A0A5D0MGA7_9BACT|nr:MAG: TetR/AcrR family transcriptional regulator [Candidatus Mcinerneyibacterium aminivorans]
MEAKKGKRVKIIEASQYLFMRYSISKVTVKEIADHAGVSKKTIYNYFDSKNELQKEAILSFLKTVTGKVNSISQNDNLDFFGKIERWINFASRFLFDLNEVFIEDVQKNHPDIWKIIEHHRKNNILKLFSSIINCGKKEGYVKEDIDEDFISELFYQNIKIVTDADFIYKSNYSIKKNVVQFVEIFFNGLLKDKKNIDINL